jgi:tRNA(Ile2)-agmatinylcytidine synthase
MDEATRPYTFNNVDMERGRVVITPRGPDPILFGVRGENAGIVKKAFSMIRAGEPIERWVIFRTNQGTDAHLNRVEKLSLIRPFSSVVARGTLASNPVTIPTRHVFFSIVDESAQVDCAAYEPTGALRKTAGKLIAGDFVEVYGGVKEPSEGKPLTVNLEKIKVMKLVSKHVYRNPTCPKCGKRLKSMGRDQGFRCEKCGLRDVNAKKTVIAVKRDVKEGLYITSTRSQRHLTKPRRRYGMEKGHVQVGSLIDDWHFP